MDHVGIDVHEVSRQVCVQGEDGELRELRIPTSRDRLWETLGAMAPAEVLLEARGWTDQRRTRLATVVEALLAHPQWAAAVEGALDSDDRAARAQGERAARLLDIDTFERLSGSRLAASIPRCLVSPPDAQSANAGVAVREGRAGRSASCRGGRRVA